MCCKIVTKLDLGGGKFSLKQLIPNQTGFSHTSICLDFPSLHLSPVTLSS